MDHPNPSPGEEAGRNGEAKLIRGRKYTRTPEGREGESSRSQQEHNNTISLSLAKRPERLGAARLATLDGFAWKTRIYSHACQIELYGDSIALTSSGSKPKHQKNTDLRLLPVGEAIKPKTPRPRGHRVISYWYGSTDGCASVLEQEDETGSRNLNPDEEGGGRRKVCATWDVVGDFATLSCRVTPWMAALRCTTSPSAQLIGLTAFPEDPPRVDDARKLRAGVTADSYRAVFITARTDSEDRSTVYLILPTDAGAASGTGYSGPRTDPGVLLGGPICIPSPTALAWPSRFAAPKIQSTCGRRIVAND